MAEQEELQALLENAQRDFSDIAQLGLKYIESQLSFFYLSDLVLSNEDQKFVDEKITQHLTTDADENEKTFYRDFILQATFIHEHYKNDIQENERPTRERMNALRETLNKMDIAGLKEEYNRIKALPNFNLDKEGKKKLDAVNEEFSKKKNRFEKVLLKDDVSDQTLEERMIRMKTSVPLGEILDFGGTSEVFQPIPLPENFGSKMTIGGMRAQNMNDLAEKLNTLSQKSEASDLLKIFATSYRLQGELTNLRGSLQNLLGVEEGLVDLVPNIQGLLDTSVVLEDQFCRNLNRKMKKNLNRLLEFKNAGKDQNAIQRNILMVGMLKSLHMIRDVVDGFFKGSRATSRQKLEMNRLVNLVAETFDRLKVSKETDLNRIIDLKIKLDDFKAKMQNGTYPFSERLDNKITVLDYEMERWIACKQQQDKQRRVSDAALEVHSSGLIISVVRKVLSPAMSVSKTPKPSNTPQGTSTNQNKPSQKNKY